VSSWETRVGESDPSELERSDDEGIRLGKAEAIHGARMRRTADVPDDLQTHRRPSRPTFAVAPFEGRVTWSLLFIASLAFPVSAGAQQPQEAPADTIGSQESDSGLRVYVDCSGRFCDFDFLRREISYVNYVRDRQDSQVHLLITSQGTGAGGRNYVLDFIGRETFEGMDDRQEVATAPALPEEEVLGRVTRAIGLGLARYIAQTASAERARLIVEEEVGEQVATGPEDDPWNFWVFRTSLEASVEGEDRQNQLSLEGRLSSNRVTEKLKVELSVDGQYDRENFEVNDSTTVKSIEREYEFESLAVWSLGDHWSAGAQGSIEHSSFRNQDLGIRIAPALEYNLFRYEDSERKQFTLLYSVGFNSFDWKEETLFGKTSERRFDQSLRASLAVKQTWGEAGGELQASHYLDEPARHRFDARVFVRLRVVRGLSFNVSLDGSRVRDQINIPAGDATPEEILLEIRELETEFEYDVSLGFSYTFGSIFNNVVNPRFEGGHGRRF
jgi:hypothetical protein